MGGSFFLADLNLTRGNGEKKGVEEASWRTEILAKDRGEPRNTTKVVVFGWCLDSLQAALRYSGGEADKRRRARFSVETPAADGSELEGWLQWRDKAQAPGLIDEGSSKVRPGAVDDCIVLSLSAVPECVLSFSFSFHACEDEQV